MSLNLAKFRTSINLKVSDPLPMSPGNESLAFKRKYPRRIFQNSVGVLYKGTFSITTGASLGEGGMAFHWPNPLQLDHSLIVTFKIPGDNMISIRADVRNSKPSDQDPSQLLIGIQFLPLPIGEKRRIRAYVSSRVENEPTI